jgi:hypothetical protein
LPRRDLCSNPPLIAMPKQVNFAPGSSLVRSVE